MTNQIKNSALTVLILFSALLTISCEPAATFNEPQPAETKSIHKIPLKMRGKYISANDSSTLIVSATTIRRVFDLNVVSENNTFDSVSSVIFDREDTSTSTQHFSFSKDKNGSKVEIHYSDTLFHMGEDVLKKYKGYYFLNSQRTNGNWVVHKAKIQRKLLTISSISREEDFKNLQDITNDSTEAPHTFDASKQEFKQFIQQGGFKNEEVFVRM